MSTSRILIRNENASAPSMTSINDANMIAAKNDQSHLENNEPQYHDFNNENTYNDNNKHNKNNMDNNEKYDNNNEKKDHDGQDNEENDEKKYSLSHYFSTLMVTFMVISLVATALLFLWSNRSDGAYVRLYIAPLIPSDSNINVAIKDYSYSSKIFSFTLISSIQDFWSSQAYGLALLIAAFSGLWPYVKLLLFMTVWLQPMKPNTRSWILEILDQLGKFSFIDLFVCMFMVVSFYVRINEQIQEYGLTVHITVEPDIGMTTFVIGTIISMIYNHIFIYLDVKYSKPIHNENHKRRRSSLLMLPEYSISAEIMDNDDDKSISLNMPHYTSNFFGNKVRQYQQYENNNENDNDNDNNNENQNHGENENNRNIIDSNIDGKKKSDIASDDPNNNNKLKRTESYLIAKAKMFPEEGSALYDWMNNGSFRIYSVMYTPRSFVGIFFRCLFLLILIANTWAMILVITIAPVRYNMKGLAGDAVSNPVRAYSVWDVGSMLPFKTDMVEAGWFLAITFFITAIITPIGIMALLATIWLIPLTYKMHRTIISLLFPIQAWAALDVFLISSVAASVELERVSQWIIDQNFSAYCGPNSPIAMLRNNCFSVVGHLTYGTYLMGACVGISWLLLIYTLHEIKKSYKTIGYYNYRNKLDNF